LAQLTNSQVQQRSLGHASNGLQWALTEWNGENVAGKRRELRGNEDPLKGHHRKLLTSLADWWL